MSDLLDDSPSIDAPARKHGWRQGSTPPVPGELASDEPAEEFTGGDPRSVGPLVALALLTAAALIIALAVVTVTAGSGDAPRAEVAGVTELSSTPRSAPVGDASTTSTTVSDVATSVAPTSTPTVAGAPRSPIELDPGELVLTTFYREVPSDGGEFSLAVRLENGGSVDFALADVEFLFEVGGEIIPAEETISTHGRVPAGGSAVVTVRVSLPVVAGTPELVVTAVNGELARAVLP